MLKQEFLVTVKDDIQELLKLHWQEIALNKEKIKLNPDWDAYEELERRGALKISTSRKNGELIGYLDVLCSKNLHYKDHVFASNDVIYLHPDHRKGFTGIKLIKFAERCLKEDGVSVLAINTKVHRPFDKVLEFLGFNLTERLYSKYLGD